MSRGRRSSPEGASVLVIVQNLPVPLDRRVWSECLALRDAGYRVSVICPQGPGDPSRAELDGIHLYKYRPPPPASGFLGYVFEFAYCWLRTAWLSVQVYARRGFRIIQACNPPDTYWLLGRLWKIVGVRFVFDHHDLNPELFISRFGEPRTVGGRIQLAILFWLERMAFRTADHVISTNESYRSVALSRGTVDAQDITIVRSGPDTRIMRPVYGDPALRKGHEHLLVYLGIMGPQDGVDVLLRVMYELVHERGRKDVHLALLGFGDMLEPLRELAGELRLDDWVTFTGRADKAMIADYLSTAEIGLCPDTKTALNEVSTHNKVMEYMAYALPIVAFDLKETRVTAQDCAIYVPSGSHVDFAKAVDALLWNQDLRVDMSRRSRTRCVSTLDWSPQTSSYVQVYDGLSGRQRPRPVRETWPASELRTGPGKPPVIFGRQSVDLRDSTVFDDYLRRRGVLEASPGASPDEE